MLLFQKELEEIKARLEAAQAETNGFDEKEVGLKREITDATDAITKLKDELKYAGEKVERINKEVCDFLASFFTKSTIFLD